MFSNTLKNYGLTGNQLKIIALITMTIDHVGVQIFPHVIILRIIGRLSFPIFAFMIAEGCRYTRNRKKHLGLLAVSALICQIVYFFILQSLYQCVLVTFMMSVILIYSFDNYAKHKSVMNFIIAIITFVSAIFICEFLPQCLANTDFCIDYGIWGVLLPVFIYIGKNKEQQLILLASGLLFLCICFQEIQWFSFVSIIPLSLYNGRKGSMNLKYLFYIYYPLHLAAIFAIDTVLEMLF